MSAEEPREFSETRDGVEYRYSSAWTRSIESEAHWRHYWKQAMLVRSLVPVGSQITELGVGSGFLANYLRSCGYSVQTVDVDPAKRPDVVANIVDFDGISGSSAFLAFEVFEHMPMRVMLDFLSRARERLGETIVISVPVARRRVLLEGSIRLARVGTQSFALRVPGRRPPDPHHHWELNDGEVTAEMLVAEIERAAGVSLKATDSALGLEYFAFQHDGIA